VSTSLTTTSTAPTLATAPATALVARAQGAGLPSYVTPEQARAIVDAATTTRGRLLAETLWQSGGRVSEVARLRRCDVDPAEGALRLVNLKQRRRDRAAKLVYVSGGLVAALLAYCTDARVGPTGPVFASRQGAHGAITRQQVYNVVTALSRRAGVTVVGRDGQLRPATGLDFRHGAAVHQLRAGVPLSEVSQQLGHARLDTTTVYVRLANAERRRYADRVAW
jgi:integrase